MNKQTTTAIKGLIKGYEELWEATKLLKDMIDDLNKHIDSQDKLIIELLTKLKHI